MISGLRIAHRWLGVALAGLWALQALSGVALVFARSLDDWSLRASGRPADLAAIDRSLAQVRRDHPGARVVEYLPSGGADGQIDVLIAAGGGRTDVVRLDGASGVVLREGGWSGPPGRLGPMRALLTFHKQLWSGDLGRALIGASGLVLAGEILAGLRLAWPARGRWRAALTPGREKVPAMAALRWHRAVALWLAPLALASVLTGAAMSWSADLQRALAAAPPPPRVPPAAGAAVLVPSAAARAALGLHPDARLAEVVMPRGGRPWYLVRLRRPGEWRRVFGTTLVYVDARTGAVVGGRDALAAPAAARFVDGLYPVHTGEWAGLGGRLAVLAVGVWLAATTGLGIGLWLTRRRMRRTRPRAA
jgi:uncharacterized iron-regulated membrane protein